MMATWTETLYERLLTRLPPKHVHAGWNDILLEEFKALNSAVDGVTSAYTKLEEVREAVTKLQQGHPTGGSSGLLQTVESTVSLQNELEKKLQKVATTNTSPSVTAVERKRKRGELKETSSSGVQQGDQASKKRQLADQITSVPTERVDKRGESDCSKAALKQAQAKSPDSESAAAVQGIGRLVLRQLPPYYKTLVENASTNRRRATPQVLADALLALKEWVDNGHKVSAAHQLDVIKSLEAVLSWVRAEGNNKQHSQKQLVPLYQDYMTSVEAYVKRLTCPPAKKLIKLVDTTSTAISKLQFKASPIAQWVTSVVSELESLSHEKRMERLLSVVAAFNQAETKTLGETPMKQICSSCQVLSEWISAGPLEPHDVAMYRLLLEAMRKLAPRLTKGRMEKINRLAWEMELKLP